MSTADQELVLGHFIVSEDVEWSRRFYVDVLGGNVVFSGVDGDELTYVALANTWIIINVGGGPTDDKPTVELETPRLRDPDGHLIEVAQTTDPVRDWAPAAWLSDMQAGGQ